jgi:hypothetical protein
MREGITSVYDDERTDRPTCTVTVGNTALVNELLGVDRRVTVRGITEQLLSLYALQRILTVESFRWVHGSRQTEARTVFDKFLSVTRHTVKIF